MNKKLALLIVILAIFATTMQAQRDYRYGLFLGVGANTTTVNSDMYYDDSEVVTNMVINGADTTYNTRYLPIADASVTPIPSFTIGAYYEIPFNDIVGLQMRLLYNKYGYAISGKIEHPNLNDNAWTEYKYSGSLKMSNISAAILLKFNVFAKDLSVEAGVTPSFCIKMSKDVERGPLHKTLAYKNNEDYKAFNLCGTIGVTWYWLDSFFCALHVNVGLLDVLKTKEPYIGIDDPNTILYKYSDTKSKTNSVYFTVGYRWN